MLLDTGLVKICELLNTADSGNKPLMQLKQLTEQYFGEKQIGFTRQYAAKSVDERIDMIIQIWAEDIRPYIGYYAVIGSDQFRIDNVQGTYDEDGLAVYVLTLSKLETHYDVIEQAQVSP